MTDSAAERYVRLGLRLGRHVDGIVDAYFGPPELKAEVDGEPQVERRALVADADGLLGELEDGWLRDQVVGLRTYAGALAGEAIPYADEVEGCYGVRPSWTEEAVFDAAHQRLEDVLPGDGSLAERHKRWKASLLVPAERVEETIGAVIETARGQTRGLVDLPAGEGVEVEIVRDKPWWAFCGYLGDLRSTISVNVDLPMSAVELLRLAMHETYPGHHTERACKEQTLVRDRGLLEETIVMVPTPQSLVAEGIAVLAAELLLDGDGAAAALTSVLRDAGIELDFAHARAVERALDPCRWAEVNAALMLHERGANATQTQAYLERWGLLKPELAAHLVRFFKQPTSRTYILTYPAARDLCRSYVGGAPERFARLLTEQVRVPDLLSGANERSRAPGRTTPDPRSDT